MKNLKASEAVDCSTNFEILRYAQDDRESAQDDRESAQDDDGQCVVSEEILRYAQDDNPSHSSSLRRIALDVFTDTRYLSCNSVAIYH